EQQPVRFAAVEKRKQVGVLEIGGDSDFLEEARRTEDCGKLRIQDLERNGPVMADIMRPVDRGHATAADLTLYAVAIRECGVELLGKLHRSTPPVILLPTCGRVTIKARPARRPYGISWLIY